MARVIPVSPTDEADDDQPLAGLSTPIHARRDMKSSASHESAKPRRSIYPAPSPFGTQQLDVKPDVKPKFNKSGTVLQDLNRLDVSSTGDVGGSRGGGSTHVGDPGRRSSGGERDVKPEADELSFHDKMRVKQEHAGQVQLMDDEIASVETQVKDLNALLVKLKKDRANVVGTASPAVQQRIQAVAPGSKGGIDYLNDDYEWSTPLKTKMKQVFGIDNYRLCQEGVCNANMDGRDIICIMPTGGGKSLTYQLPSLLGPGTTVVISPLLSLIADQLIHLHENDIPAVMLTGAVDQDTQSDITTRLVQGPSTHAGSSSSTSRSLAGEDGREIKLVYVTPEKISKSKAFRAVLQKMYAKGNLTRFVIDEAHCVSQLGHDYRPDYKALNVLRQLYPKVPIMAVTATCSRKVLPDLLKTLQMGPITPSDNANSKGTVFFDAPLYRKNLHYKVVTKPSGTKEALAALADYITDNHAGESGIVYCLSKKDAETVADGLLSHSKGKIKTGVYHAEVSDSAKDKLHHRWRDGKVNVVVATIAFGLGIDKGNVRFVLHHSMSKSLDGYYQETGRAGRDGEDASCVLFYRAQDASRMSGMIMSDDEGQSKLREMTAYAQDIETCRKILFGRYFSNSASLPSKSWAEKEEKCGHCDNCMRDPTTIERRDVTLEAWKVCKVSQWVKDQKGRLTVSNLGDLVRGLAGGAFGVVKKIGKKGKTKISADKEHIDLDDLCGGKSELSKDAIEALIMHLLLDGYLEEVYSQTAYNTNVYVEPTLDSIRLSRLSRTAIDSGVGLGPPIIKTFPVKSRKSRTSKTPTKAKAEKGATKGKGKSKVVDSDEDDQQEDIDEDDEEDPYGGGEDDYNLFESNYNQAEEDDNDEGGFPAGYDEADFPMDDDDAELHAQLAAAGQAHLLDPPSPKPKPKPKPPKSAAAKVKSEPRSRKSKSRRIEDDEDEDAWEVYSGAHGGGDGPTWGTVVAPMARAGVGGSGSAKKVTGGGRVVSGSLIGGGTPAKRRRVDEGGGAVGRGEMIELSSD